MLSPYKGSHQYVFYFIAGAQSRRCNMSVYLVIFLMLFRGGAFCDDIKEEEDATIFAMVSEKRNITEKNLKAN